MDNLAKLLLKQIQMNLRPNYLTSSQTEVSIRCPYCGDSVKSERSAHLYIELMSPYRFYCQRCSTGGMVTPSFLKDIKLYNNELSLEFYKHSKDIRYQGPKVVGNDDIFIPKKDVFIPEFEGSELELSKLDYLNGRLGLNLTHKDIETYRLILNFGKFFMDNEIGTYTIPDHMMANIHEYGLGFLSYDKSHIVFRSIVDEEISGFRYFNYNIFNDYDNTKKFYSVKNTIDILNPKVKVVISEGIFDIIGIREHLYNGEDDNTLFFSVNGKGYNLIFNTLHRMGFLDLDVEIYSDKDVGIDFYRYIKNNNEFLKYSRIKVYYNRLGKDFGVPKENIEVKYTMI